jgi:hypothetical protein
MLIWNNLALLSFNSKNLNYYKMSVGFWELKGMVVDILQFSQVRKILEKSCICFPSIDTTHNHISKELMNKLFKSNNGR